jgi:hypothetical protein
LSEGDGYHSQKKTFTYSEKSEEDRAEYLAKIESIPLDKRVYVDECGIKEFLCREYGRAVRGVKVEDVKRGKKFQRLNVVAAQFQTTDKVVHRVVPYCYSENTNSVIFEQWYKTKLVKSVARGSTIIMDRASFHRKKRLQNLSRRHGVRLLLLPAYSPDLSPIEKTWANMKQAVTDSLDKENNLTKAVYGYFGVSDC